MSETKPWDRLRQIIEPKKPPLTRGSWQSPYTPKVTVVDVACGKVNIRMGSDENCAQGWEAPGLRQLAEFANELADQLEGK